MTYIFGNRRDSREKPSFMKIGRAICISRNGGHGRASITKDVNTSRANKNCLGDHLNNHSLLLLVQVQWPRAQKL